MCIKGGVLLFVTTILLSTNCFCWGFYAHQKINYQAEFLLPPEMMVLYQPHLSFLTDHSGDADKRRYVVAEEGPATLSTSTATAPTPSTHCRGAGAKPWPATAKTPSTATA